MTIDFKPGQVWTFKGRPQDGDTHLGILAVTEHEKLGTICSIAITNVTIRNPHVENGVQEMLPHAPVVASVVEAAVGQLVAEDGPTSDDPEFNEAFNQWLEPFEEGKAGVFTISVVEILDLIETAVSPAH
jgi:hypothetical protein